MTDEVARSGTDAPPRGRLSRSLWTAAGFVAVGVGSLGAVVPVLPTTGFFVLAAWCFGKGSPRFEQWVLSLPTIGPLVADYRDGLGMPRRAKIIAITMMWVAIGISGVALRDRPLLVGLAVVLGLVGTGYLLAAVPTRERVLAERGLIPPPPPDGRADPPQ